MTSKMNAARIGVILLFAMTFAVIGWSAPIIYATYVPSEEIIEVHSYEAQDTTTNSNEHYVCFDREVDEGTSANVVTELYLLSNDGERIEVSRSTDETYFQEGRERVVVPRQLPNDLQSGEYRYVVVTQIDMAAGQVTRELSFTSDPFMVTEGKAKNPTIPENCR